MRVETMLTSVILRLHAMDFTTLAQGTRSATMRVPATSGRREFRIKNRNVLLDGRHDSGRMQHLRAEIGQLGGFGERDGLHAMAAGHDGGVGGQHAVDIGPDLDLLGADTGADDGGREVGAAAAQRGGDAVFVWSR